MGLYDEVSVAEGNSVNLPPAKTLYQTNSLDSTLTYLSISKDGYIHYDSYPGRVINSVSFEMYGEDNTGYCRKYIMAIVMNKIEAVWEVEDDKTHTEIFINPGIRLAAKRMAQNMVPLHGDPSAPWIIQQSNMNFMLPEVFERLKKRWDHYTGYLDDSTLCDPEIKETLKIVNEHPSLVTIYSCQGHICKNQMAKGSLMFGVLDQAGLDVLFRIQHKLAELRSRPFETRLTTEYKRDTTRVKPTDRTVYPVWILAWTYELQEEPVIHGMVTTAAITGARS